jgi:hypothetical protein
MLLIAGGMLLHVSAAEMPCTVDMVASRGRRALAVGRTAHKLLPVPCTSWQYENWYYVVLVL